MDVLFHVESKKKDDVNEVIGKDPLHKVSAVWQKCSALDRDRDGYYLMMTCDEELCEVARDKIGDKVEEITGDQKDEIVEELKDREEKTLNGVSSIFG